jgi:ATP-dependent helicase/nuclease subunit A
LGCEPSSPPSPTPAWGTLIRLLLEHAMRHPGGDRARLQRLANWFAVDKPELRRVLPEALDTVERVMASELWRRALAAEERQVEAPFAARVEGDGGVPHILYGVVDLAFRKAGSWSILDYKTDQAGLQALAPRSCEQVGLYASRWAALTGDPVIYAGILAARHGEVSGDLLGEAT